MFVLYTVWLHSQRIILGQSTRGDGWLLAFHSSGVGGDFPEIPSGYD